MYEPCSTQDGLSSTIMRYTQYVSKIRFAKKLTKS